MKVLKFFCRALDFLRRVILNLLFWGAVAAAAVLWVAARPSVDVPKPGTILVLDLEGALKESDPMQSFPGDLRALFKGTTSSTRLIDVTQALRRAASDPNIVGVIVETEKLTKIGLAGAHEIGKAIDEYKTLSGKPVLAWAASYSQGQYAAIAHADVVALHPMGSVMIKGLSASAVYWGGLLERLGIGVSVFKAGVYKSAPEVFSRREPTKENIDAQRGYLDEAWSAFSKEIETARGVMPGALNAYLEALPGKLEGGGDPALIVKKAGLVTDLMSKAEFDDLVKKTFDDVRSGTHHKVSFRDYLAAESSASKNEEHVAVVLADGAIAAGGAAGIDPEELTKRIDRAASGGSVRALILRISTPGGDALGAEAIREKLESVRAKGLPVIVSMGDAAASGGYWLSLAADRIVAEPLTITGSIGVFSIVPDAAGALEKLDLSVQGWRTSEFADFGSPLHAPNAAEAALLKASVERTYERFKKIAAQSRHMDLSEVERVAQGHVWTGTQALELKLVDKLGGINDAIKLATQLAELAPDAPIRIYDESAEGASALVTKLLSRIQCRLPSTLFGVEAALPEAALLKSSSRPLAWLPEAAVSL